MTSRTHERVRYLPYKRKRTKKKQRPCKRYSRNPCIGGAKCCAWCSHVCVHVFVSLLKYKYYKNYTPRKSTSLCDLSSLFRSLFGLVRCRSPSFSFAPDLFVHSFSLLCSAFSCPSLFLSHSWRYLCITRRAFNIFCMCLTHKARLFYSHQFSTVCIHTIASIRCNYLCIYYICCIYPYTYAYYI